MFSWMVNKFPLLTCSWGQQSANCQLWAKVGRRAGGSPAGDFKPSTWQLWPCGSFGSPVPSQLLYQSYQMQGFNNKPVVSPSPDSPYSLTLESTNNQLIVCLIASDDLGLWLSKVGADCQLQSPDSPGSWTRPKTVWLEPQFSWFSTSHVGLWHLALNFSCAGALYE